MVTASEMPRIPRQLATIGTILISMLLHRLTLLRLTVKTMRNYRSKYNSRKVTVAGVKHDSQKEANRFRELSLLERAGKITDLQRQVRFELIPAQYESYERYSEKTGKRLKDGKRCIEKSCVYVADFLYLENGKKVVEDTKSDPTKTKDYIIKRKLMLWVHGIRIKEV